MSTAYLIGAFGSGLAPGTVPAPAPVTGHAVLRYTTLLQLNTTPGVMIPVTPVRLPIIDGVLCSVEGVPSTTSPIPVQATNDPMLAQTGDVYAQIDLVFDGGSEPVQVVLELPASTTVDVATTARAGSQGAVFVSGLTPGQLTELHDGLAKAEDLKDQTEGIRDQAAGIRDQAQISRTEAEAAADRATAIVVADVDPAMAGLLNDTGSQTHAAVDPTVAGLLLGGTETRARLDSSYVPIDGLRQPIDVWDEFRFRGEGGYSWDAQTYAGWIAGVDALLGGFATKATVGTASGGVPVYAYTAGPENAPHVLLIGGTHGHEAQSQYATMRFFEQFARGSHPVMQGLRTRVKITWIPTLSAGAYRAQRQNANGVDVNRNFAFLWDYYVDPDKGPSAMSEPESKIVKALLDSTKIACVIDAHMLGDTGAFFQHSGPSTVVTGNRRLAFTAANQWNETYNRHGVSFSELGNGTSADPVMKNWASKYLRYDLGRHSAAAVTLEARVDMAGATWDAVPREFMRLYCGFIHLYILEWLATGQVATTPAPVAWYADMGAEQPTVSIQDGGSLIDTQTAGRPIHFAGFFGASGGRRPYIDVPVRSSGAFVATVTATLESQGDSTTPMQVSVTLGMQRTSPTGGNISGGTQRISYVDVPPAGQRASFTGTLRESIASNDVAKVGDLYRFQVFARRMTATGTIKIRSMLVTITHFPYTDVDPVPGINLSA